MATELQNYQQFISNVPQFLEKYLEVDILKRLKGISYLCGMDYASKDMYDFSFPVSRFDHSLNVALIVWRLTHNKRATLVGLFHDVSTPVFSHVIDYMNGDYINQESTEAYTEAIINSSDELKKCLLEDNLTVEDIADFKKYSVVDLDRPKMCADRLDGILTTGMAWLKKVRYYDAIKVLRDTGLTINENGEEEITFLSYDTAFYVLYINDLIDKYTHSEEDTYMMILLSRIVKKCIELGIVTYDELYHITEPEMVLRIEENVIKNSVLDELWTEFRTTSTVKEEIKVEVKNKKLNPLMRTKRII